jgi:hypothetical protein
VTKIGVQTPVASKPQKCCLQNVACRQVSGCYDSGPQRSQTLTNRVGGVKEGTDAVRCRRQEIDGVAY